MVKERAYHQPVVIFTIENMDVDKSITVVNLPHVRVIGGHSNQRRIGNIQGLWDLDRWYQW